MKNKPSLHNTFSGSFNVKSLTSPTNKKVQGFDKTTSSNMFNSKITKLKNKPKVQNLEDQYITGLQDQIKYLQMELKLLQEKDQERHGQIDQLEKFFGDGIPINENILAIKNGFNNYKNTNEQKIKHLSGEKHQRSSLINQLGAKVQQLLDQVTKNEKQNKKTSQQGQNKFFSLIFQESALKKQLERQDEQLKNVKMENRKLFENIQKITRNKLINNITLIKHDNNKFNKLNDLRQTLKEKQAQMLDLQKQYAELLKAQQEKSYLLKLEQDNLNQRKKVISLERDSDSLKSKIKDKQIELEQKLRQRMTQINYKLDIKNKVQTLKQQINHQNTLTVQAVNQITRQREVQKLKRIVDTNQQLSKHIDHYGNVLSNIENSIQGLAQRKPQAKEQLTFYNKQVTKLIAKEKVQKERQISLHASMIQTEQQANQVKVTVVPVQQRTRKKNQQIQAYLEERKRLLEQIKIKQKQLELIFILKNLNFEEVEITKTSNNSIQQQLTHFLKNWQKIQRIA